MKPLTLVVPCFNESENLARLVERTAAAAARWELSPRRFRLLIVDNGSTDRTPEVLDRLVETDAGRFLKRLRLDVNRGYGHGVWQGLLEASRRSPAGGLVGWMHGDGQCDPEDALRAQALLGQSSLTLVKGRRTGRALGPFLFTRAFEAAASVLWRERFHEVNAMPKVFPAWLVKRIAKSGVTPPGDFSFDGFFLREAGRAGLAVREIPVQTLERVHGESSWSGTLSSRARAARQTLEYLWRERQVTSRASS